MGAALIKRLAYTHAQGLSNGGEMDPMHKESMSKSPHSNLLARSPSYPWFPGSHRISALAASSPWKLPPPEIREDQPRTGSDSPIPGALLGLSISHGPCGRLKAATR